MRAFCDLRFVFAIALFCATGNAAADWRSMFKEFLGSEEGQAAASALSNSEVADGLREALSNGVRQAVNQLGRTDGFLANAAVRIPVPDHLKLVDSGLRTLGQGEIADAFVTSLNRAAEQAVPVAADVFAGTISSMTVDDAKSILNGGDTAATEYLRRTSHEDLHERFTPLVDNAVRQADVTAWYQKALDKAGPAGQFIDTSKLDLTAYVTDRALEGLYTVVGEQERLIRDDPAARTSALLKKVFAR